MIKGPHIPMCTACDRRGAWTGSAYACPVCDALLLDNGGPGENLLGVTKAQIIEYARSLLGVKYVHLGRSVNNGLDCIGLLRAVAQKYDLSSHDFRNYPPSADGRTLIRELDKAFGVDTGYVPDMPILPYEPGDVLVFWIRRKTRPMHAGIFIRMSDGRPGLLHTYATLGKVSAHGLNEWWSSRLCKVYKWPGVEDEGEVE